MQLYYIKDGDLIKTQEPQDGEQIDIKRYLFLTGIQEMLTKACVPYSWYSIQQVEDWQLKFTWDEPTQEEFREWYRNLLSVETGMSKAEADYEIAWFMVTYGLKTDINMCNSILNY